MLETTDSKAHGQPSSEWPQQAKRCEEQPAPAVHSREIAALDEAKANPSDETDSGPHKPDAGDEIHGSAQARCDPAGVGLLIIRQSRPKTDRDSTKSQTGRERSNRLGERETGGETQGP